MTRRRGRGPWWVAVTCAALLLVWWTHQRGAPSGQDVVRGVTVHANTSTLPLSIRATAATWNGRPVYRLVDQSNEALSNLVVYSWSNEPIPIVWSGNTLPNPFPEHAPVAAAPVKVLPGQSAWFEFGEAPPQKVTVVWRHGDRAVYEVLTIG